MRKTLHLSIWLFISMVMITGCSLFGGSAVSEEPGEAEAGPDSPAPSAMDVIQKAEESMMEVKGARYDVSGDQNMQLTAEGKTETVTMDFNAGLHLAREPFGIHLKGHMNTDARTVPIETYLSEGVWYQRIDEGDWMRTKGPAFGETQGQPPLPAESLKQFRLVQQSGGNESIQMTIEEEAYILKMNLSEEGLKKQLGDAYGELRKELEPAWEEIGFPVSDQDPRLVSISRRLSVDKETFIPTQLDHMTIWEVSLENGSVTLEQNMIMSYAGETTKPVIVPPEVKENARRR